MWLAQRLINIVDALYIKPLRGIISRDLFGYGLCGAINMMLDIVWYFIIYHYVVCAKFIDVGFDKLLEGTYEGAYQNQKNDEFIKNLSK